MSAMLSACVVQSTPVRPWKLDRPLRDYYDTAFLFTDGGRSVPHEVNVKRLAGLLQRYDVVIYGESHGHPGVHLREMKLLRALYERDPRWVLSLEQFERDVQGIVDDYTAGHIGETALIEQGRAWSNYAASYRPMVEFAKDHHLPVVAAEAPGWAVTCVGQSGLPVLDRFTPAERSWVAARVDAGAGAYRDEYMQFLGGSATHGGDSAAANKHAQDAAQNSFAAQVTRDDTMAESIDRALRQHPGYRILHLTGSFHAAKFLGTVERLRALDPTLKIAVIAPVQVDPRAPEVSPDEFVDGTVLQLIYPDPEPFVAGEDMSAWTTKMKAKHSAATCKYALADGSQ
jgi:uncharacterized iron-regulated protein